MENMKRLWELFKICANDSFELVANVGELAAFTTGALAGAKLGCGLAIGWLEVFLPVFVGAAACLLAIACRMLIERNREY